MYREQLRYFVAAYQLRSYHQAPDLIHITPQGLAKAVRALEQELGVPLLAVHQKGALVATPFADEFYAFIMTMADEFAQLNERFETIHAKEENHVRIGFPIGMLNVIGVSYLNQFQLTNAEASLIYREEPDAVVEEKLAKGYYDLAFTFAPFAQRFETEIIGAVPLCQWINTEDSLSDADVVRVGDLQSHELATPGEGFKSYALIQRLCSEAGISPKGFHISHDTQWIWNFVERNRGIGTNLGVWLNVSDHEAENTVVTIPFEHQKLTCGLSWPREKSLSRLGRLFVAQTVATFKPLLT